MKISCQSCGKDIGDKKPKKYYRVDEGVICSKCYNKAWEQNNRGKNLAHKIASRATCKSKINGWPAPDFDSEWIYKKILAGRCEVTNIPFDLSARTTSHARNPMMPSLDRIDSKQPYLKDNVKLVVYMYNACKSQFAHEDVVSFCNQLVNNERAKDNEVSSLAKV